MRFFISLPLSIFVTLFSCSENSNRSAENDSVKYIENQSSIGESNRPCDSMDLKNAVSWKDTTCPNGIFVKYPVYKDHYGIKIGKGKTDTLLRYQFDCSVAGIIVPWLEFYDDETIVLARGSGASYWVYLIYTIQKDKIIFNGDYVVPIAIDLKTKRIAYPDTGNGIGDVITVKNFTTGASKSFPLPFMTKYVSAGYSGKFRGDLLDIEDEEKDKTTLALGTDL